MMHNEALFLRIYGKIAQVVKILHVLKHTRQATKIIKSKQSILSPIKMSSINTFIQKQIGQIDFAQIYIRQDQP